MDIKLFKLYRHPFYLPPYRTYEVENHILSFSPGVFQDIRGWWLKAKPEFKEMVLSERKEDDSVEVVGVIIEKLKDVTIFSYEYEDHVSYDWYQGTQIIANNDIIETLPLKEIDREPTDGDMVCAHWINASHNNIPTTIDMERDNRGLVDIVELGFLMDKDEERVIIGGTYNSKSKKYIYTESMPATSITDIRTLSV